MCGGINIVHLKILTMQSFTRRIDVSPDYSPEFAFNRIAMAGADRYHVSVSDRDGVYQYFNMDLKNEHFRIVDAPKVADWIMKVEEQLERAIFENMNNEGNSGI